MVLDDGTLVAKIGQPMTNYQNDKIKIDGDAIRGYTVIASFDEI